MSEDTNPYETPLSDLASPADAALSRRDMVPLWIRIFGWIFIAIAALVVPLMIWGMLTGENVMFELFGLRYTGPALKPYAFAMVIGIAVLVTWMSISGGAE